MDGEDRLGGEGPSDGDAAASRRAAAILGRLIGMVKLRPGPSLCGNQVCIDELEPRRRADHRFRRAPSFPLLGPTMRWSTGVRASGSGSSRLLRLPPRSTTCPSSSKPRPNSGPEQRTRPSGRAPPAAPQFARPTRPARSPAPRHSARRSWSAGPGPRRSHAWTRPPADSSCTADLGPVGNLLGGTAADQAPDCFRVLEQLVVDAGGRARHGGECSSLLHPHWDWGASAGALSGISASLRHPAERGVPPRPRVQLPAQVRRRCPVALAVRRSADLRRRVGLGAFL